MDVMCNICNLLMKTRINGSHLKRKHNISINEYKLMYPNANIGIHIQKNIPYLCKICNTNTIGSTSLSRHLKLYHDITLENYYITYILNGIHPVCICGCNSITSFDNMKHGFHKYVFGHSPKWNTGLTKETDIRIFNIHKH